MSSTAKEILKLKAELIRDDGNDYDALVQLRRFKMTKDLLKETQIGKLVAKLRDSASSEESKTLARELVDHWKRAIESPSGSANKRASEMTGTPQDSEIDLTSITDLEYTGEPKRDRVRELLFGALRPRTDEDEREPALVAVIVEDACFRGLKEKEYFAQIRSIKFNLSDSKNADFRRKVLTGFFAPELFPSLKAEDMASSQWNEKREQLRKNALEECQSDWALRHGAIQASGMFQCGKCKGSKTTYFQMQTRSADEPMTTFVTCLTCKNKWKFC